MLLLVDLDGVVYRASEGVPGVGPALAARAALGDDVVYVTNNAMHYHGDYLPRLEGHGAPVGRDRVVTSARASALYVRDEMPEVRRVLAVGASGLERELREAGLDAVTAAHAATRMSQEGIDGWDAAGHPDAVVVGLDPQLTYLRIAAAADCVRAGSVLVATNRDPIYPTERGFRPGAGAVVAAIETASQTTARVTIGKPEPYLLEAAARLVGARRVRGGDDRRRAHGRGGRPGRRRAHGPDADRRDDPRDGRCAAGRRAADPDRGGRRGARRDPRRARRDVRTRAAGTEPRRARSRPPTVIDRRRTLPLLVAMLLVVVGGCAVDPKADVAARLRAAQARWAAAAIDDYRFTLAVYCLCPFQEPVEVTVRDGQVASVTAHGVDAPADDVSWYPLTMELALRAVEDQLDAEEISVTFDPTLGYPTHVSANPDLETYDDEVNFEISNFVAGQ